MLRTFKTFYVNLASQLLVVYTTLEDRRLHVESTNNERSGSRYKFFSLNGGVDFEPSNVKDFNT